MTNENDKIIMPDSPEAAQKVTLTMWKSRNGTLYLDNKEGEKAARYDGSTHGICSDCGEPAPKHYLCCNSCLEKRKLKRLGSLPHEEWDGEFPVYSELLEEYIFDDEVIDEQLEEYGRTFDDLLVMKCKPNRVRPIDPDDYCYDDLPDDKDGGAPNEVVEAAEKFNEAVKDVVLSYSPMDIMLTWSHQKLDTDHTPEVEVDRSALDCLMYLCPCRNGRK